MAVARHEWTQCLDAEFAESVLLYDDDVDADEKQVLNFF